MMKMLNLLQLILFGLIVNGCLRFSYCGRSRLKQVKDCDSNANYLATFHVAIKNVGDNQFIDAIANLTVPFDNTIQVVVSVETLIVNSYQYLLTIKERKACEAVHKYCGEFWYDLERHAQLIPGMCPGPKGVHRVHNFPLELEKITTLLNFPFGTLRNTIAFYNRNNEIYSCVVVVLEHIM